MSGSIEAAINTLEFIGVALETGARDLENLGPNASQQIINQLKATNLLDDATITALENNSYAGWVGLVFGTLAVFALATPIGATADAIAVGATALVGAATEALLSGAGYGLVGSFAASGIAATTNLISAVAGAVISYYVSKGGQALISLADSAGAALADSIKNLLAVAPQVYNGTATASSITVPQNIQIWNGSGKSTEYSIFTNAVVATPDTVTVQENSKTGIVQGVVFSGSTVVLTVNYGDGSTGESSVVINGGTIDPTISSPPDITTASDGSILVLLSTSVSGQDVAVEDASSGNTIDIMLGSDESSTDEPLVSFDETDFQGNTIDVTDVSSGQVDLTDTVASGDVAEISSDESVSGVVQDFDFAGSTGTLKLDAPASFVGTVYSFQPGDTIDLAGIVATGASFDATTDDLTVQDPNGTITLSLDPTANYSDESFLLSSDGSGGTDVSAVSDSGTISFTGENETLLAPSPANLMGMISDFQSGDTIDLAGVLVTSASITGTGVLLVQEETGSTLSLQLGSSQSYADETVFVVSDGNDGSDIVAEPAAQVSNSQTAVTTAIIDTPSTDGGSETQADYSVDASVSATDLVFTAARDGEVESQAIPIAVTYTGGNPDPNDSSGEGLYVSASGGEGSFQIYGALDLGPDNPSGTLTASVEGYVDGDNSEVIPLTLSYQPDDPDGSLDPSSVSATVNVNLDFKVYTLAAPSYSGPSPGNDDLPGFYEFPVLHVGQTSSVDIAVTNTATGSLTDSLVTTANSIGDFSTQNGVSLAGGQTGDVTLTITAAAAGLVYGDQSLFDAVSHDPDLPDQADLGSFTVGAVIYNYAQPVLASGELGIDSTTGAETVTPLADQSGGTLIQTGTDSYTLDFGTVAADDTGYVGNILLQNAADVGYSDALGATYSISGGGFIVAADSGSIAETTGGDYAELGTFTPDFSSLGSNTMTVVFDPTSVDSGGTTTLTPITLTVTDDVVAPCFAIGTRVATQRGEIAVEALAIGEVIQTQGAGLKPITWIGHRHIDCRRHPRPRDVWPVRIEADAFGPGMPHRDLFLSPDHAIFVEGVLIPIKHLVNGSSIALVPVDEVTYYHIELPEHDVLLAEGLPAESYLDTGDRANFSNGGAAINLFPDFSTPALDAELVRDAKSYARLMVCGPEVEAARRCAALASASSASLAVAAA